MISDFMVSIKYPANCATRLSVETNMAASMAASDGVVDVNVLDQLYEPKENKKLFRVMTVIVYIFSVSTIAILLSLYYLFLWNPYIKQHRLEMQKRKLEVKKDLVTTTASTSMTPMTSTMPVHEKLPHALPLVAKMINSFDAKQQEGERENEGLIRSKDVYTPRPVKHLEDPFVTYLRAQRVKEHEKKMAEFDANN